MIVSHVFELHHVDCNPLLMHILPNEMDTGADLRLELRILKRSVTPTSLRRRCVRT